MRNNTGIFLSKSIALFISGSLVFCGCASLHEKTKGVLGISTNELEKGRSQAVIKVYAYDYDNCYKMVKKFIKEKESYIFADDPKKQMIAVYYSYTDTTPIGIFFKIVDSKDTQVEITSESQPAKELFAKELTAMIESSYSINQGEKQDNEKKETDVR